MNSPSFESNSLVLPCTVATYSCVVVVSTYENKLYVVKPRRAYVVASCGGGGVRPEELCQGKEGH